MQNNIILFLSTGRCGTQWFADKLFQYYSENAQVIHEKFHASYAPRKFFSNYHNNIPYQLTQEIEDHFSDIDDILTRTNYIEVGWPIFGLMPYIINRYKNRIKIVHLFRNPIHTAASLTTHEMYKRGEWTKNMCLTPFDDGVKQKYLTEQWPLMSEFEKCLFFWTEVNNFALDLKKSQDVPWLSLKFEDVFSSKSPDQLNDLLDFLEFPVKDEFLQSINSKKDRFSNKTYEEIDINSIHKYPAAIETMHTLGYEINRDISNGISRYKYSLKDELIKKYKKLKKSI